MLFYILLLIIKQLQLSVDFAVRDQQEIILKYLKHEALTEGPKQDILAIWCYNGLLFNRNGQKLFRNFSLIIFSKIIIPDNSLQDLHEVPEHLRSARKRHRSALCDALPDKEVPSVWSISDNSCKKIISAIRLNPLFKKNLCISVGEYSLYSSYLCS